VTIQQAYYRMILKEYGLTDEAMRKLFFAATLVNNARIDLMCEELNPPKPKIDFFFEEPRSRFFLSCFDMKIVMPLIAHP
jgi:hypothetical protein